MKALALLAAIAGHYDFTLEWSALRAGGDSGPSGPGIFTAFAEQLGLRLVPSNEPVDVLIIDHGEMPSKN